MAIYLPPWWRAVWLPSLLTILTLCIGLFLLPSLSCVPFFIASVVFLADTKGRYRDWLYLSTSWKHTISWRDFRRRLDIYGRTACGRQVVLAVWPYVGSRHYKEQGYKWYHLLPDKTFTKDSPFLKIKFWINLVSGQR